MDVIRDNFHCALRLMQRLLPEAAFVAIDFEFTGLGPSRPSQLDTPEQRYDTARQNARNYPPIQFGITIFHKRPVHPHCFAIPFNFNIFPHPVYFPPSQRYPLIDSTTHFQGSTIHFLANNRFDFDRLMKDTISWLRPVDEVFLRRVVSQHITARRNPTRYFKADESPAEHVNTIAQLRLQLNTWIAKNIPTPPSDLSQKVAFFPFPYHPLARRLAFDMIHDDYPLISTAIVSSQSGSRLRVALHPTEPLAKQQRQDDITYEIDSIVNNEVGIRAVIDLLRAQHVPIVVHNGLMDLTKLYANFVSDLPPLLSDFKRQFLEAFPTVYDTRFFLDHLWSRFPEISNLLPSDTRRPHELADFVNAMRKMGRDRNIDTLSSIDTFVATEKLRLHDPAASSAFADDNGYFFVPENNDDWNYDADAYGFGRYCSPDESDFRHEAGFDSVETGKMFALMEALLQSGDELTQVANKVFLGSCGGYGYMDLKSKDAEPNEWFDRNVVIVQGGNAELAPDSGREHMCRRILRRLTVGTIFVEEKSDFVIFNRTGFLALLSKQKDDDVSLDADEIEKVICNGREINADVKLYEMQSLQAMEDSGEIYELKRRRVM